MRVLLTGGSGFLGSHVAEQLSALGHEVVALVRKSSDTRFLKTLSKVKLVEGATDARETLDAAVAGVDAVIHAAGLVKARSAEEFRAVNTQGTRNVLDAVRKRNGRLRRFVQVSSLAVAGPSDRNGSPVPRDRDCRPVTQYGHSKLAAEQVVLALKDEVPVTILRPPAIYGPRDREILAFFKSINMGVLPLTGSTDNKLSMIYGADCANACIRALEADVPSGSVYYIDDGAIHTFADLIHQAEAALGRRAWLRLPIPPAVMKTAGLFSELYGRITNQAVMLTREKCNELLEQWVCDGSEARKALGWEPRVSFAEGVRLTVEWYKRAGWL